jgi:hypothetical protein
MSQQQQQQQQARDHELTALGAILPITGLFLRKGLCLSEKEARLIGSELARFLAIKAIDRDLDFTKYSPSPSVDEAWHLLMLMPKKYHSLCVELCGSIIDHDLLGGDDAAAREQRYAATLARYTELFGQAPTAQLWPFSLQQSSSASSSSSTAANEAQPDHKKARVEKTEKSMEIFIKDLKGQLHTLSVYPSDSLDIVKEKIQDISGTSPDQQRLIFAGRDYELLTLLSIY